MTFQYPECFVLQGAPQNMDPPAMGRTDFLMQRKLVFPRSPGQSKNPVSCEVLKALMRSEV